MALLSTLSSPGHASSGFSGSWRPPRPPDTGSPSETWRQGLPPAPVPEPCGVPTFAPLPLPDGRRWPRTRFRGVLRRRRRALAAGLAVTAAALAAWLPRVQPGPDSPRVPAALPQHAAPSQGPPHQASAPADPSSGVSPEDVSAGSASAGGHSAGSASERRAEIVSAPVRIADAETVRLLEPGDRVDVIAAPGASSGEAPGAGTGPGVRSRTGPDARIVVTGARVVEVPRAAEGFQDGGALIVLAVPRPVATALAGAGATSRLAVALC